MRVAILGDHATQSLTACIQNYAIVTGLDLELYEAAYDQIDHELVDSKSGLYAFEPSMVLFSFSSQKLRREFYSREVHSRDEFHREFLERVSRQLDQVGSRLPCKVLLCNLNEINDNVFGSYSSKTRSSFINQVRRINVGLMDLSEQRQSLFLVDVQSLVQHVGAQSAFSPQMYTNAGMVFHVDFCVQIAKAVCQVLEALEGRFKKCVIVDLDNTLWGGVIGDDGIEKIQLGTLGIGRAFIEFQSWLKELKNRGVILTVCSKNTESIAKEPFLAHPEMQLTLGDISVFVANWENKADNIRHIQSVLNIGFDSMVFLDDNPAERELVRLLLPEVVVPELPPDPAEYVGYLAQQNLFETVSYSAADESRTKQYQQEAQRRSRSAEFTDIGDYLKSLDMRAWIRPFTDFDVPRIAQLSQRSNQFNLRTVRYTEEEIKRIQLDPNRLGLAVNLEDRFGDYGLVSIVIGNRVDSSRIFIDSWIMSCRVLNRGLQEFVLNKLAADIADRGYEVIVGEYIETNKNAVVADHYKSLGFQRDSKEWSLQVSGFAPLATHVSQHSGIQSPTNRAE